jgi:hypothetical protein
MYPAGCPDDQPLGEVGLKYLFEKCPQFELLQIKCRAALSGPCFHSLGTNIKALHLNTWLSDEDFQILTSGNGRHLQELQMMAVYEGAFKYICTRMMFLKKLILDHITLQKPSQFRLLENLKQLQVLNVGLGGESVDEELVHVMQSCSGLKQIMATLCGISDHSMSRFSRLCPLLEKVEIYNYSSGSITDRGLEGFQDLSQLQVLAISESDVTDARLLQLLDSCHRLRHLNLSGCKRVTCAVTQAMVRKARAQPRRKMSLFISEVPPALDVPNNLSITQSM